MLEQADHVAPVWRRHYDRLHLHSDRGHSALPGLPMPRTYPRYPDRARVVEYLEAYAAHYGLAPEFGCRVDKVRFDGRWRVETSHGERAAEAVIVALGQASFPAMPDLPGMADFPGETLHSSTYRNAGPYRGKRVLVIGFGNSGGEIGLDLAESGVDTAISVRGPVNIVPRDILGIPILTIAIRQQHLPKPLVNGLNRLAQRLFVGDIRKLGLVPSAKAPQQQIREDGRVPLLDIGTVDCIRRGALAVRPGIDRIDGTDVVFADGRREPFDVLLCATGFRPDLRWLLPDRTDFLDELGQPRSSGAESGGEGLYFCSYRVAATGQLREIGLEATEIAASIDKRLAA